MNEQYIKKAFSEVRVPENNISQRVLDAIATAELLSNKKVELFINKVLREVPVSYYYQIKIKEELCNTLLEKIEKLLASNIPEDDAVLEAVKAMGRPQKIGKELKEKYKSHTNYKRYAGIRFLNRWLAAIAYFIVIFLFSWSTAAIALTAVLVVGFWGLRYPKWQYVLLNVFAPLIIFGILIITMLSGGMITDWMINSKMILAWVIPAIITQAICYCVTYLDKKARNITCSIIIGLTIVFMTSSSFMANENARIARTEYNYNLQILDYELDDYLLTPKSNNVLAAAIESFDSYTGTLGSGSIKYATSDEFSLKFFMDEMQKYLDNDQYVLPNKYREYYMHDDEISMPDSDKKELVAATVQKIDKKLTEYLPEGKYYKKTDLGVGKFFYSNRKSDLLMLRHDMHRIAQDFFKSIEDSIKP